MPSGLHGDLVSDLIEGAPGVERERAVAESWQRCLTRYHIDPEEAHHTRVLTATEVRERLQRSDFLLAAARAEMVNLRSQLGRAGYTVILTDAEGVVLKHYCDPGMRRQFESAGLWQGADWSETTEGTNGIGTCIVQGRPVTVHKDDHFRAVHTPLSCSGAPIHDPAGHLLGALDVSSVNRDDTRESQQSVLSSVIMSARTIENAAFLHAFREARILRFHVRRELIGLLNDALLALDPDDRILGANACALNTLGILHRDEMIGRPAAMVVDLARVRTGETGVVGDKLHGRLFYARLDPPAKAVRHLAIERPASPSDLDDARLGADPQVRDAAQRAYRVMLRNIPILLQGETGAGKEYFARTLHIAGPRAHARFLAVNCSSIPENLIESELFGYAPGAFTGARREGMRGVLQQVDGGTLFLDEIGDMPLHLQAKLLRVLETNEVTPLGSERSVKVDFQVISATHRDVASLVEDGSFRDDLYYRLNGISFTLPPLRERDDIADLIDLIVAEESADPVEIEPAARAMLLKYSWPGNLRQLRNVLRVAMALCDGITVRVADLPVEMRAGADTAAPAPVDDDNRLASAERDALLDVLARERWNMTRAAAALGMSRNTLYRKVRKHGIDISRE